MTNTNEAAQNLQRDMQLLENMRQSYNRIDSSGFSTDTANRVRAIMEERMAIVSERIASTIVNAIF